MDTIYSSKKLPHRQGDRILGWSELAFVFIWDFDNIFAEGVIDQMDASNKLTKVLNMCKNLLIIFQNSYGKISLFDEFGGDNNTGRHILNVF